MAHGLERRRETHGGGGGGCASALYWADFRTVGAGTSLGYLQGFFPGLLSMASHTLHVARQEYWIALYGGDPSYPETMTQACNSLEEASLVHPSEATWGCECRGFDGWLVQRNELPLKNKIQSVGPDVNQRVFEAFAPVLVRRVGCHSGRAVPPQASRERPLID